MTRDVERLEKLREILQCSHTDYLALATRRAPGGIHDDLVAAFDPNPADYWQLVRVCELGLGWRDLLVLAMVTADEVTGPILQRLHPDLWAELEDEQQPLRDDDGAAADRAYSRQLDDQLGVL